MEKEEVWKDIIGYEGMYQVSTFGRVKSIKFGREKILKLDLTAKGYQRLQLRKYGGKCGYLVHRLVGIAFIPNPYNKSEINHKDKVKTNNYLSNLEWATQIENLSHKYSYRPLVKYLEGLISLKN